MAAVGHAAPRRGVGPMSGSPPASNHYTLIARSDSVAGSGTEADTLPVAWPAVQLAPRRCQGAGGDSVQLGL